MKKTALKVNTCFENFFKFQDDCNGENMPGSGLFYDLLPGVSRDVVARWADGGKHANANEFARTAFVRALSIITQKLKGSLSGMGLTMNSEAERVQACDMSARIAAPGGWRGIRVSSRDMHSPFACLRVDHVIVKTCSTQTIELHVRDAKYQIIDTIPVNAVGGVPVKVDINKEYPAPLIYIGFNQAGINVYESDCRRAGPCCMSAKTGRRSRLLIDGWNGTYQAAGVINSAGFGVSACISLICKHDNLACEFKDSLAWALLYATGVQMLLEARQTRRITHETEMLDNTVGETLLGWQGACDEAIACELEGIKQKLLKDKTCFCCQNGPNYSIMTT